MMKCLVVGAALVVAGCAGNSETVKNFYGPPQVLQKSPVAVKIWAGYQVSPDAVAAKQCGEYGRTAELRKSESYRSGYETVYWFDCV